MPESLTVCSCNGVSKGDLMRAWEAGDRSVAEVSARTRATTGCGGCSDVVAGIVEWLAAGDPDQTTSSGALEDDTQRKRDAHEMEMSRG
jgi:assimilatory nitrate reductase electron transfer subunit